MTDRPGAFGNLYPFYSCNGLSPVGHKAITRAYINPDHHGAFIMNFFLTVTPSAIWSVVGMLISALVTMLPMRRADNVPLSWNYRKISNIRRTKPQNLNDSRLVLQLSLPNLLKPSGLIRE